MVAEAACSAGTVLTSYISPLVVLREEDPILQRLVETLVVYESISQSDRGVSLNYTYDPLTDVQTDTPD